MVTFGGVWNTLTAVAQNRVRTEFGLRKTVAVGPVTCLAEVLVHPVLRVLAVVVSVANEIRCQTSVCGATQVTFAQLAAVVTTAVLVLTGVDAVAHSVTHGVAADTTGTVTPELVTPTHSTVELVSMCENAVLPPVTHQRLQDVQASGTLEVPLAAFWELVTVVLAVWLAVTDVVHGHTLRVVAPELGLSAFSGFALCFIRVIAAVVNVIAHEISRNAEVVGTFDVCQGAKVGFAVPFITSILAIVSQVTSLDDVDAVRAIALKLVGQAAALLHALVTTVEALRDPVAQKLGVNALLHALITLEAPVLCAERFRCVLVLNHLAICKCPVSPCYCVEVHREDKQQEIADNWHHLHL